ncbi:egg cell-secreted protein 1.3-like [Salvia miltiorrhiza]|uniref:egg cell-secreted protein 1.3-like n=1 Tax=Salvia miltiorrhiza TaxID=226208 RepID=UPI0025AC5706|nr:egg cell-secreted protein 1.3-like [Salvia miltiorrhiza]
MAFSTKLLAVVVVAVLASPIMTSARKVAESRWSLAARLKVAEEGPSTCWDALFELQSCSGEVVMFFLNGETQLGENCCSAIKVIERQCWPSMLGTLGITTEETNVLRGYCDATAAPPPQCYNFPRLQLQN